MLHFALFVSWVAFNLCNFCTFSVYTVLHFPEQETWNVNGNSIAQLCWCAAKKYSRKYEGYQKHSYQIFCVIMPWQQESVWRKFDNVNLHWLHIFDNSWYGLKCQTIELFNYCVNYSQIFIAICHTQIWQGSVKLLSIVGAFVIKCKCTNGTVVWSAKLFLAIERWSLLDVSNRIFLSLAKLIPAVLFIFVFCYIRSCFSCCSKIECPQMYDWLYRTRRV